MVAIKSSNVVYDVKGLLKDLDALQPGLRKQLIKDAKAIGQPIASNIKNVIPTTAPLSGMSPKNNPTGRLAWGAGKPANSVTVKFKSGRSRSTAVTPLVAVWVNSPMTAIADIAGKGSMRKAKLVTSEYAYKGGYRQHKVTTQGKQMIRNLKSRNLNDFVYVAVGDSVDDAEVKIKLVIKSYSAKVNRKLN